jgi:hypothetical protein
MAMRIRRINPASLRNLQAYVRDLPREVAVRGSTAIKKGAEMYAEALKEAIRNQEYASAYPKLNEDYELRKVSIGKVGDYPAFWMFDMNLMDAIDVVQVPTGGGNRSYVVGFNSSSHTPSGNNKDSDLTNAQLAEMLEFGYGVPARPVVQPTWDDWGDTIRQEVLRTFSKYFAKDGRVKRRR